VNAQPGRTVVSRVRVRYAETDQMGVVYHTHYLVWCEIGRTDFIRQFGATYADLERQGLILPVVDVHVRYLASARYDDTVRIETTLERAGSRFLTFAYEIFREAQGEAEVEGGGEHLATASVRLVAVDPRGRPTQVPAELRDRFRAVLD
jgi:acyl-CoA thioester hydrolase